MVKLQEFNYKPRQIRYLTATNQVPMECTKYFGVEIEMELTRRNTILFKETHQKCVSNQDFLDLRGETNYKNAANAFIALQGLENHLKATKFYAKRDGSLIDGVELVSHPFTLEWLEENQGKMKSMFRRCIQLGFNSYDTGTCGMHIHISRSHFTGVMHLMRFYQFFQENAGFFHNMSRRTPESSLKYSFYINDSREHFIRNFANGEGRLDHHEAIELRHAHTIEIRIFRGTLNYDSLKAYIYLLKELVNYTQHEFYKRLSVEGFQEWLKTCKKTKPIKQALALVLKTQKKQPLPTNKISKIIFGNMKEKFAVDYHISKANARYGTNKRSDSLTFVPNGAFTVTRKYWAYMFPPNGIETPVVRDQMGIVLGWPSVYRMLQSFRNLSLDHSFLFKSKDGSGDLAVMYRVSPLDENNTLFFNQTVSPVGGCPEFNRGVSLDRLLSLHETLRQQYQCAVEGYFVRVALEDEFKNPFETDITVVRTYWKLGQTLLASIEIPGLFDAEDPRLANVEPALRRKIRGTISFKKISATPTALNVTMRGALDKYKKNFHETDMKQLFYQTNTSEAVIRFPDGDIKEDKYELPLQLKDAERVIRLTRMVNIGEHLRGWRDAEPLFRVAAAGMQGPDQF